jgi:TetR/AcrR family transcriptional regulator, mexJK operon transcriptional repressor
MPIRRGITTRHGKDVPSARETTTQKRGAPRHGGRPSRVEAVQLGETILDAAAELFLTDGYGVTSIESIARRARISKRTFYSRYRDKAALFGAVVHRVIERLRPSGGVDLYAGGSLEEVLTRLAQYILRAALTPEALALHRVILAEATRFPELAAVVTEQGGSREAITHIAALLERDAHAAGRVLENGPFAAAQFLQMVVALPQRRAHGLGTPMTAPELDAWARDTVSLFLNGCRADARA